MVDIKITVQHLKDELGGKIDEKTITDVLNAYNVWLHDRRSKVIELADVLTVPYDTAIIAERGSVQQPWTIKAGTKIAVLSGKVV